MNISEPREQVVPMVDMTDENVNQQSFQEPSHLSASQMRKRNQNQANVIKNRSACSSVEQ